VGALHLRDQCLIKTIDNMSFLNLWGLALGSWTLASAASAAHSSAAASRGYFPAGYQLTMWPEVAAAGQLPSTQQASYPSGSHQEGGHVGAEIGAERQQRSYPSGSHQQGGPATPPATDQRSHAGDQHREKIKQRHTKTELCRYSRSGCRNDNLSCRGIDGWDGHGLMIAMLLRRTGPWVILL